MSDNGIRPANAGASGSVTGIDLDWTNPVVRIIAGQVRDDLEAKLAPATTEQAYSTGDNIRYPDAGQPYPERVDARLEAMEHQIAMALAAVERMQARANARIAEIERQIEDWSAGR